MFCWNSSTICRKARGVVANSWRFCLIKNQSDKGWTSVGSYFGCSKAEICNTSLCPGNNFSEKYAAPITFTSPLENNSAVLCFAFIQIIADALLLPSCSHCVSHSVKKATTPTLFNIHVYYGAASVCYRFHGWTGSNSEHETRPRHQH